MADVDHRSEAVTRLREGIVALTSTEQWRRHLDCQSRFHRYSFGNVVLIASQRPESTRVAGFRTWQAVGRTVRRGEKAIWILAPVRARKDSAVSADGDPSDGHPVTGFRPVPVFDIAQTEGEDLPEVCRKLSGDDTAGLTGRLVGAARALGYSVQWAALPGGVNGDCSFSRRRIRIEEGNAPVQQVKTLAHEVAHGVLHEGCADRGLAELEAESVAYVVCRHLGVDTGSYSFGYVASWAGGGAEAVAGLKASGARIQGAAAAILNQVEGEELAGGPGGTVGGSPGERLARPVVSGAVR